jgi:hypothetical protein
MTTNDRLVERLRDRADTAEQWATHNCPDDILDATVAEYREAADLIQSQQATIERLREALRPFADCVGQIDANESDEEWAKFRLVIKNYRDAAASLNETTKGEG